MSIPTDPPYCLVYPTSYVKGIKLDHFDTHNSPAGMRLHHCVCRTTLQFSNNNPKERTNYIGSHLILPRGVQYKDQLYPSILEPQNHHVLLIDPTTGELCPMEVVGNFRAVDPIFKGCYGDSLLYSKADLAQLRQQKVYLPAYQGKSPCHLPHLTSKSGSQLQPSNPCTGWQLRTHLQSPPRPSGPAARVGPTEALDTAPIPQSAQITHPPRSPLIPRTTRQSLHRPTALASVAICPSPLQGLQDTNEGIFMGWTLVWWTPLLPLAPVY